MVSAAEPVRRSASALAFYLKIDSHLKPAVHHDMGCSYAWLESQAFGMLASL